MYKIKSNINPHIYRGYDLRGVVGKDLDEDVYYTLGRAYATFLSQRRIKTSTVGRDNRTSSTKMSKAFIQGLNDGGINTIDIGSVLTQIVYYSSYEFKCKGSAMITASHNPKQYNGLKLGVGYSDTMISEEIQQLKKIAADQKFSEGKGENQTADILESYTKDILKHFSLKKKWKVVVEGCNTNSGVIYPNILRQAGCEVIEQNCESDGNFPMGVPDPTEVEVLERLAKGVKTHKADIGFAYDADGDRMAVVDEKGQVLWMDTIVALFSKDVLEYIPNAPIIYNTLCSKQVTDAINEMGGQPIIWKTGHSFIKAKVKQSRSPFGGELSGHIFFMDNFYGHDDGAYACLRLLQYLERKQATLSKEVAKLNFYVSSPEIKFGLSDDIKFEFIDTKITQEFKKQWPDADYIDIDGIRMDTKDTMAIIRASQNGPYMTVKFEGKTQKQYDQMKKTLKNMMKKYDEIDWNTGVNTHELD